VIDAMRGKIQELGCEFRFNCRCTGFIIQEKDGEKTVTGLKVKDTKNGTEDTIVCDAVLLATGHSATDIYMTLAALAPESLESKGFAFGVRVEHPRALIDSIQYHGDSAAARNLGAAEYRLTSQVDSRGVYSFCMCPGGFIVPSSSEAGQIVINGMSAAGRNSLWSNAAIVVETHPEDIPEQFQKQAKDMGCPALAGLLARNWLEKETCKHGDGNQKAPAQRLLDYLAQRESPSLPRTSYTPGIVSSRLDEWLPPHLNKRLPDALRIFDEKMKGYISDEALIVAIESRTSTPVRILRDKSSGQSPAIKGLYPAGEGSGYSGGIASSAMDGMAQCACIIQSFGL
ncbi:MAG: FAD-binding protein, partial [Treponema sp.]|nr:FAD-binding protein [Treponema sp.]